MTLKEEPVMKSRLGALIGWCGAWKGTMGTCDATWDATWDADHLHKIRELLQQVAILAELGDEPRMQLAAHAIIEQVISLRDRSFRAGEAYGRGVASNVRRSS